MDKYNPLMPPPGEEDSGPDAEAFAELIRTDERFARLVIQSLPGWLREVVQEKLQKIEQDPTPKYKSRFDTNQDIFDEDADDEYDLRHGRF